MGSLRGVVLLALLAPAVASGCLDSCENPRNWRDEGAKVERFAFSTDPDQMDDDEPLEQAARIFGFSGVNATSRSHPFDADAKATVYRRVNDTSAEPYPNWTAVTTWNFTIQVQDFTVSKPSSGPCQFRHERLYVDDEIGVDGEGYKLHVVVVLRADGRQLEHSSIYAHQTSFDPEPWAAVEPAAGRP